jgi:hypothetical protein
MCKEHTIKARFGAHGYPGKMEGTWADLITMAAAMLFSAIGEETSLGFGPLLVQEQINERLYLRLKDYRKQ